MFPNRRVRSVSPPPSKVVQQQQQKKFGVGATNNNYNKGISSSSPVPGVGNNQNNNNQNTNNNNNDQQNQTKQQTVNIVPSVLLTTELAELLHKMRESTQAYRDIIAKVEKVVMDGIFRGEEEHLIVSECRRIMAQNPIMECDLK